MTLPSTYACELVWLASTVFVVSGALDRSHVEYEFETDHMGVACSFSVWNSRRQCYVSVKIEIECNGNVRMVYIDGKGCSGGPHFTTAINRGITLLIDIHKKNGDEKRG